MVLDEVEGEDAVEADGEGVGDDERKQDESLVSLIPIERYRACMAHDHA